MADVITDASMTLNWLIEPIDGSGDGELVDAVLVALGTDRLADPDDILPGLDDDDRRGWWGDLDAGLIYDGWPIGSRIWILTRQKITGAPARQGSTVKRVETYVREALQPFVDKQIATRLDVSAERVEIDRIDASATLYRGPVALVDLRYAVLWGA
jgi:phage gp46-like protein